MKKFAKSVLGVTLLEIMLVLAIAAMIIVMSVRYYQSATSNQQANATMQIIQALVSAADQLAQPTGSYSGVLTSSALTAMLPGGGLKTPWGTTMTVAASGSSAFVVTLPSTPSGVCPLVKSKLAANNHYGTLGTCGSTAASFSFTYTANP